MYQRHDLLLLDGASARRLFSQWRDAHPEQGGRAPTDWQRAFAAGDLPGIVRRPQPEDPASEVALGFSFPLRIHGQRQRFAATVLPQAVVRCITPFQAAAMSFTPDGPALQTLAELREHDCLRDCPPGVWGSAALQIVSGFSYTDAESDLDLLINACSAARMQAIHHLVLRLERKRGLRIDVEVRGRDGYGFSMKELMAATRQVMGKSLHDVRLFDKAALLHSEESSR